MKIVHLNTNSAGGSYEVAALLSRGLAELGHESVVFTRSMEGRPWLDKLLRRGTLALSKGAWHGTHRRLPGPDLALFGDVDIVHLHTVADWFNVPDWLAELPERVKVVVGLHDLWHISGGCFVYNTCNGFVTGCGKCPQLRFPANYLLARHEAHRKSHAYRERNVCFVANSQWLADFAGTSSVVDGARVETLRPPVDTEIFFPRDRLTSRKQFGVPVEDRVVATGCASLTDRNKDTSGLLELLATLDEPRLHVVVFGAGEIPSPPGLKVTFAGPMKSKEQLACLYSAADVFATASRMETYGLTLVESLACGTPVIAYRVGGIPEAVPQVSGAVHLCEPFDCDSFRQSLREILGANPSQPLSTQAAVEAVHARNSVISAARSAVEVYESASPESCRTAFQSVR